MTGLKKKPFHFYAVNSGRKIGIFNNWNEAAKSVTGFKGAKYKGYGTLDEAIQAMRDAGIPVPCVFNGTAHEPQDAVPCNNIGQNTESTNENNKGNHKSQNSHKSSTDETGQKDREETFVKEVVHECAASDQEETHTKEVIREVCVACDQNLHGQKLKCSDCSGLLHISCTKLPLYQVCVFLKTHRKYTCEGCAKAFIDERTEEELTADTVDENERASLNSQQNHGAPSCSSSGSPALQKMLTSHHQDIMTVMKNLADGVRNMTEQSLRQEESRSQTISDLFHQVSKASAPSKPAVKTAAVTAVPITCDTACQTEKTAWEATQRVINIPPTPTYAAVVSSSQQGTPASTKPLNRKNKKTAIATVGTCSIQTPVKSSPTKSHRPDKKSKSPSQTFYEDITMSEESNELFSDSDSESSEKQDNPLPSLHVLCDSVLKGVDAQRLGDSYVLHVTKEVSYTSADLARTSILQPDSHSPDAVVIHVGINDLKSNPAQETAQLIAKTTKKILKRHPKTTITISEITTAEIDLQAKAKLCNATLFSELYQENRVNFLDHPAMASSTKGYWSSDKIHPTQRGSSVLAATIGRHVQAMFWTKVERRPKPAFRRTHSRPSRDYNEPLPRTHYQHQGYRQPQRRDQSDSRFRSDEPHWNRRQQRGHTPQHRQRQLRPDSGRFQSTHFQDKWSRYR
jgi:lysophospholipase L1-like esterase